MAISTLQNLDKLKRKMGKLSSKFEEAVSKEIKVGVLMVHDDAIRSIQSHSSSGRTYGKHTASKPGKPPNTDTGRLVSSIKFDVTQGKDGTTGTVGTNLFYGPMLEFGTSKMNARPWLGPAFKKNVKKVMARIEKHAKAILKEAGKK